MVNYTALEDLVSDASKVEGNFAKKKDDWTLLREGNTTSIKYMDRFVVLHNPAVTRVPTVFEQVIEDNELDASMVLRIAGIPA